MLHLDYANLWTSAGPLSEGAVVIDDDGRLVYMGPMENVPSVSGKRLDLRGLWIVPGFLDIHVHGGYGITFGESDDALSELQVYASRVVQTGVTGFLVSLAAPDAVTLQQRVAAFVKVFEQGVAGASPLGLHLEGPFLNPGRRGAFHPSWLRSPALDEVAALLDIGQGWIRQVTLAPELPGAAALAARFRQAGVVVALGHSDADYTLAAEALAGPYTHVTHTFNAQRGFQQREPGVLGAILTSEYVTAELIADTIHVHPGAMKVLVRCLGVERIVLISDAMAAAGLADGDYSLVGSPVVVREGRALTPDGTLAGSTATLNQCVAAMVRTVGVSLTDSVRMATLNPARAMGCLGAWGNLRTGVRANLTVMDGEGCVYLTVAQGKVVYNNF